MRGSGGMKYFIMKRVYLLFFMVLTCTVFASEVMAVEKVSVLVEGNLTPLQEQIVNNAFMSRLSQSKSYIAYERNDSFLKSITREHDFQVSGNVPESQIRKIAAKHGVDYVIAVTVINNEGKLYMSARLIHIETGKVEITVSQDRDSSNNKTLKNLSNNVAYRLLSASSK